jgi:hypothetical protein
MSLFSPIPIAFLRDTFFGILYLCPFSPPLLPFTCVAYEIHTLVFIIPCSTALGLYVLLRHRCCFIVLIFVLRSLGVGCCCLTTALSITSVTAFISRVFADLMTANMGIPFLSVKSPFCARFVPVCGVSTGHRPPKGDFMDMLSRDCHIHLIPFMSSYSFNALTHIFSNVPSQTHS